MDIMTALVPSQSRFFVFLLARIDADITQSQ